MPLEVCTINTEAGHSRNPWFFAGLKSSFPNIEPPSSSTSQRKVKLDGHHCPKDDLSNTRSSLCKLFRYTNSASPPVEVTVDQALSSVGLEEQVLVFQYRGRLHAIEHQCPHQSYPLLRGTIYDIEDFGIVLSAGITCPKHGWAFDIYTGESDRGAHKLKLWDVEIRDRNVDYVVTDVGNDNRGVVEEVWVKKKCKG